MAKTTELLLLESIEGLGIVGDIVKVKKGHARNYLLPHGYAELPTNSKIESLKEAREVALGEQRQLRDAREELLTRMSELSVTLVRSCNDKGILYGSVSQRDISDALQEDGYNVGIRSIRLPNALRRIGEYPVVVQFDKELKTEINVIIEPDQPLEEREEMEFDNEGELIERPKRAPRPAAAEGDEEAAAEGDGADAEAPAEAAPAE